ncbi:MAG: sel1 repeat family protein [Lachnospiraceae bacterium]|nr:sel1 repeat family protein [Lachnospiraceae bacterium]
MRVDNYAVLYRRLEIARDAIKDDERYAESRQCLETFMDMYGDREDFEVDDEKQFSSEKLEIAMELHDTDPTVEMQHDVAALLTDIYDDLIAEGNDDAMCNLGSLYYTGRGGTQDYEKAAYYYEMASKAGNRQATENLGYIYYYGRTGEVNYEKAFHCFLKGALDNHLRSLYKVGDFYRNGYYVEKDEKEAFRIYKLCYDMLDETNTSHVGADICMRMGDCYFEGIGTEKDLLEALENMHSAEELFYVRLMDGDFYQKENLKHVIEREEEIRKEIKETMLP